MLMASSLIPGNENAIYRVINELTRWGANVVHKGNAKVHVSGHASAGELAYCYNIVRPTNVLPVHGEWRHLKANADIAIRTGVDPDRVLIAEDGVVIDLVKGQARIIGKVPAGLVYVDGTTVGGATEETLHVRRTLAEEGVRDRRPASSTPTPASSPRSPTTSPTASPRTPSTSRTPRRSSRRP